MNKYNGTNDTINISIHPTASANVSDHMIHLPKAIHICVYLTVSLGHIIPRNVNFTIMYIIIVTQLLTNTAM